MAQHISLKAVHSTFSSNPDRVFSRREILELIQQHHEKWIRRRTSKADPRIEVGSNSPTSILNALVKEGALKMIRLPFPHRATVRFVWGERPLFQIVQSIDGKGYFSHYTAMGLHGLTDQIPKTVYFNVEQGATGGGGSLSQVGIDRAFKGKCRVTTNMATLDNSTIYKLNGQNTQNLGVVEHEAEEGYRIRVTDLERTLIDATVRPIYSGGVGEVAQAYRRAAGKISVSTLVNYLETMNFTYPYHQAIGFYLEKAGKYSPKEIEMLRTFPMKYDFYLNYQIKNPAYDSSWKVFIPKGF